MAINCNPDPDTQDRLRLPFTILVNRAGEGASLSGTEHSRDDEARVDPFTSNSHRHQRERIRAVLRHGAHGQQRDVRPSSRLRDYCRHSPEAAQRPQPLRMVRMPDAIPTVRRGLRAQPAGGREGPSRTTRTPATTSTSPLLGGTNQRWRRRRQGSVNHELQVQTHPPEDMEGAGTAQGTVPSAGRPALDELPPPTRFSLLPNYYPGRQERCRKCLIDYSGVDRLRRLQD